MKVLKTSNSVVRAVIVTPNVHYLSPKMAYRKTFHILFLLLLWPSSILDAFRQSYSIILLFLAPTLAPPDGLYKTRRLIFITPLTKGPFMYSVQKKGKKRNRKLFHFISTQMGMDSSDMKYKPWLTWWAQLSVNCLLHNLNICKIVCIFS